jgi:hypothetical protein
VVTFSNQYPEISARQLSGQNSVQPDRFETHNKYAYINALKTAGIYNIQRRPAAKSDRS